MDRPEILRWLRETDDRRLGNLYRRADCLRARCVGDEVHLRGLVEFSNRCGRRCLYCGLRAGRRLARYRMSGEEILACARQAVAWGCGTIVLQSGEDPALPAAWLAEVVRRLKADTPLAVTLSVGERGPRDLALWRRAGADRYLLRFETSDRALYDRVHPPSPGRRSDRLALLAVLRDLGYQVGSGVMIGLPGQSYVSLARDVALFAELELDMIGVGPFLPHPGTPLGRRPLDGGDEQVPNTQAMTWKVLALARLACPHAHIPATTALATINPRDGYEQALARGANVIMPDLTPAGYRARYEIYPGKAARPAGEEFHEDMIRRIHAAGRTVGVGRGDARLPAAPPGGRRPQPCPC